MAEKVYSGEAGDGARGLPAGWRRDESGALRRETVHSMLRRMVGWDYRQRAIYEITVTLADRASQALGRLEVRFSAGVRFSPTVSARTGPEPRWLSVAEARRAMAAPGGGWSPEAVEARVVASALGEAVERCWEAIPRFYPQARVIGSRLMPDHFHGLLFVTAPLDCHLGQVVKGFKTGCNKAARDLGVQFSPGVRYSATVSPSTERAAKAGGGLFAEGFNDSILLHDGQLGGWFRYLADNPRRLAVKLLFPDLFKVVGELAVQFSPTLSASAPPSATLSPRTEPSTSAGLAHFAALGNRFLLERPLAQVQVSRRDFGYRREPKPGGELKVCRDERGEPVVDFATPAFAERREALFAAARHGAVLISPCVSDGERQIAREALAAGLPLVALRNKGFARLQKPAGRAFDACAAGRLLMLAPAAWPYTPAEKPMTRFDATAMNRLCQWLAGPGAAEISYRGMKPANVDALARQAARVLFSASVQFSATSSPSEEPPR